MVSGPPLHGCHIHHFGGKLCQNSGRLRPFLLHTLQRPPPVDPFHTAAWVKGRGVHLLHTLIFVTIHHRRNLGCLLEAAETPQLKEAASRARGAHPLAESSRPIRANGAPPLVNYKALHSMPSGLDKEGLAKEGRAEGRKVQRPPSSKSHAWHSVVK